MKKCSVQECERQSFCHGFCAMHNARFQRYGDPLKKVRGLIQKCTAVGCKNKHATKGFCHMHYERWKRNKELYKIFRRGNGEGSIRDGYRVITFRGKRVPEHRMVMEHIIGRQLLPEELVHHIDGNRLNNSPDNLELHDRASHVKLHATKTFRSSTHKQCTQCFQIKPRFLFGYNHNKKSDPNQVRCRECDALYQYVKRSKFGKRHKYQNIAKHKII